MATICQYTDARRGRIGNQRCPACDERATTHVPGRLLCDGCAGEE